MATAGLCFRERPTTTKKTLCPPTKKYIYIMSYDYNDKKKATADKKLSKT